MRTDSERGDQTPIAVRTRTVYLAEDDPQLRGLMAMALRREGADVLTFPDGVALANQLDLTVMAGDPLPDLVVTDLLMPGMSGLRVLGGVRRNKWPVPVLIVTAFADIELRKAAKALGNVDVLEKPIELEDLRAAARAAWTRGS
ncbi:MAG: response regulator [Alphaproteobacteria bacterium]|nr:response regulator [Alphaproteobacteria bacterium]